MIELNPFSLPTFITSLIAFWLGNVVYLKNKQSDANKSFFLMCMTTGLWLFFESLAYNATQEKTANILMRISYLGVTHIAITMFHFTISFLGLNKLRLWL